MTDLAGQYFDAALTLLRRVRDEEAANVERAAEALADAVAGGRRVFAFGAGHSSLPAQDVVYRAGGLVPMNLLCVPGVTGVDVVPAPLGSALERVSGLATATLDAGPARSGDLLFVVSLSGRNTMPVELAAHARARGLTVVGLTSLAYPGAVSSRHASGTYLKDHCDIVLDTKVAVGDGELALEGVPTTFGPASTVVTAALMQAVVASAVGRLADRGAEPPLFRSGNVDGGTAWNARLLEQEAHRVFYAFPAGQDR
ncbi:SIS domain-containing protein [Streptacidiphilus sp. ASG 303]|uniref:sugar isomerase domain-containing protein n=1 Tax=Streptacidiphilus sp. ASG 303 TaxID=2896847 RepID=UPI001E606EF9|nr:SIS domain-containing protein [Streptacidiphilus sp. ASG 303]MCD0482105.1 SIS domain-containing protein [Streptacidiphilus sp. ASG 303]